MGYAADSGIHGIAQQFTGGPKLTNQWWLAARGGLEAAGCREAADALPEAGMRVVFYGDLFRPAGTKAGGGPPYTADHIKPGPELELLKTWYAEAVAQEPAPASGEVTKGPVSATKQTMLNVLLRSPALAKVAERAFIGDLKQVTAFLSDPGKKERVLQRTAAEVTADTNHSCSHGCWPGPSAAANASPIQSPPAGPTGSRPMSAQPSTRTWPA